MGLTSKTWLLNKKWQQSGYDNTVLKRQVQVRVLAFTYIFNLGIITENRDTSILCMESLDTKIYLKPWGVPVRHFSVLWDKQFSTKHCDIPLLFEKLFDTKTSWNTKGSPYEVIRYYETKQIPQKIMMHKIFRYPR